MNGRWSIRNNANEKSLLFPKGEKFEKANKKATVASKKTIPSKQNLFNHLESDETFPGNTYFNIINELLLNNLRL